MTTFFVATAVAGFGLLTIGLVFDGLLDGLVDALDIDAGGGLFSAPVIGAFLGAFGVGGWAATEMTDGSAVAGLAGAAAAGVAFGWIAFRLATTFIDMPTDATPRSGDYLGQFGRVITAISRGRGEVMVHIGGSPTKLTALCDDEVDRGTEVVVVEVVSSSSVKVVPSDELLAGS